MAPMLTLEQKRMAARLWGQGLRDWKEIARACDCSISSILYVSRLASLDDALVGRGSLPFGWSPAPGRLTVEDRVEIAVGLATGESFCAIARRLGRSPSTISREVGANGGRGHYRPWAAYLRAKERARRPKPTKLASSPALLGDVVEGLHKLWSPEEIAQRLRRTTQAIR